MKKEKKYNLWPLKITVFTFFLSVSINVVTNLLIEKVSVVWAFFVLVCVVLIGIIFDIVGISVASASETPFHARNAKGIPGGKEAINLIRNAEKVSNICNDVIGDTVGVVSGGLAGAIVTIVTVKYRGIDEYALGLVLSGIVAAITVGGKAAGKNVAMSKSHDIIQAVGIFVHFVKNIFTFGFGKNGKKQKKKAR